jgi:hypothetical protein
MVLRQGLAGIAGVLLLASVAAAAHADPLASAVSSFKAVSATAATNAVRVAYRGCRTRAGCGAVAAPKATVRACTVIAGQQLHPLRTYDGLHPQQSRQLRDGLAEVVAEHGPIESWRSGFRPRNRKVEAVVDRGVRQRRMRPHLIVTKHRNENACYRSPRRRCAFAHRYHRPFHRAPYGGSRCRKGEASGRARTGR